MSSSALKCSPFRSPWHGSTRAPFAIRASARSPRRVQVTTAMRYLLGRESRPSPDRTTSIAHDVSLGKASCSGKDGDVEVAVVGEALGAVGHQHVNLRAEQ